MEAACKRCKWVKIGNTEYENYHDTEWGVPVHEDRHLFEMIILEGAQAGLSWETILKRREGYRAAFHNFDVQKVSMMTDGELEHVLTSGRVIRNRLKIFSARKNAKVFIDIQREFGTFDAYIWRFVGSKPIVNAWTQHKDVPVTTKESDALSKDLKKRGMTFVGSVIMYAYMQAMGLVNDHTSDCFKSPVLTRPKTAS